MLGSDKLFDAFCTICLADEFDDVHRIEETPEGAIYRRYFGRRLSSVRLDWIADVD